MTKKALAAGKNWAPPQPAAGGQNHFLQGNRKYGGCHNPWVSLVRLFMNPGLSPLFLPFGLDRTIGSAVPPFSC